MYSALRSFLCTALIAVSALSASAAGYTVKGVLKDESNSEKLSFVTVALSEEKSKSPFAYTLSEENGSFVILELKPGKYHLKAELLGYKALEKNFEIKDADIDFGELKMAVDYRQLDAAKVSARANEMQMKADTISFTASTVKLTENDMLEDLLKRIPGMEISEDGSITHNGKTISKITIDGKTFFLNDPQLASKNLPAKIIDKVKVIDKKSDQAEFTGIDDGNEETILDLSVKRGMMNGLFGNAQLGGGHDIPTPTLTTDDWRFQGAGFVGNFTDKNQVSFVFNANNTNNRGFEDLSGGMMGGMRGGGMGRGQGGWGGGNGITTSYMAGINGGANLFDDKMEASGNYLFTGTDKAVMEKTEKTTYLEDQTLLNSSEGNGTTTSYGNRFGIRVEHKFSDNTSIIFEPKINFGTGSYTESETTSTSTVIGGVEELTNEANKLNTGNNHNLSTDGFLLLRQKLGMPGRTMTLMGYYNVSTNNLDGINNSETKVFGQGTTNVNQEFHQTQNSYNTWANATFTQPLGGNFYLEANYSYSWTRSVSEKKTLDVATQTVVDSYSNSIYNDFVRHDIGVNGLYQGDGYRFQLGLTLKPSNTHNFTDSGDYKVDTTITRFNWAPQAMAYWDINKSSNLRFFYRGESKQPEISKLITVANNANPLNVSFGNPNLAPHFEHSLRGEYRYNNKTNFSSFTLRFNASYDQDPIVNATWYTGGIAYSMPMNGPTQSSAGMNFFATVPIAKSNFTLVTMGRVNYSHASNYVGRDIDTGKYVKGDGSLDYNLFFSDYDAICGKLVENTTNTLSARGRLGLKYRIDALELGVYGRTRMNLSDYAIADTQDRTLTWNNQVRAEGTWTWERAGLSAKGDVNYNWYRGYQTAQPSECVLNLEIQKLLLHKMLTLAVKGYDILGQAKNLTVSDNSNYHSESVNNTLGRYIIFSATLRFGSFGGKKGGPMGGGPMGGGPRR